MRAGVGLGLTTVNGHGRELCSRRLERRHWTKLDDVTGVGWRTSVNDGTVAADSSCLACSNAGTTQIAVKVWMRHQGSRRGIVVPVYLPYPCHHDYSLPAVSDMSSPKCKSARTRERRKWTGPGAYSQLKEKRLVLSTLFVLIFVLCYSFKIQVIQLAQFSILLLICQTCRKRGLTVSRPKERTGKQGGRDGARCCRCVAVLQLPRYSWYVRGRGVGKVQRSW